MHAMVMFNLERPFVRFRWIVFCFFFFFFLYFSQRMKSRTRKTTWIEKKKQHLIAANVVNVKCVHECINYVVREREETKDGKYRIVDRMIMRASKIITRSILVDVGLMIMLWYPLIFIHMKINVDDKKRKCIRWGFFNISHKQ